MRRLIIAITGASGAIYGIRALQVIRDIAGIESHAIITAGARATIGYETGYSLEEVRALADAVHGEHSLSSAIASGSFRTMGMIVAPCSIKTASGIANSYSDNLVIRAADVVLKERRPLVLIVRETPLHVGHLRLLTRAAEIGAVVLPPMPSFYQKPETISDIVDHTIGKTLDQFGIDAGLFERWRGPGGSPDGDDGLVEAPRQAGNEPEAVRPQSGALGGRAAPGAARPDTRAATRPGRSGAP